MTVPEIEDSRRRTQIGTRNTPVSGVTSESTDDRSFHGRFPKELKDERVTRILIATRSRAGNTQDESAELLDVPRLPFTMLKTPGSVASR